MHWFDLGIMILAIIAILYGYVSGLIMQLALLVGLILGAVFSGMVAEKVNPFLIDYVNMQPHVAGPSSYVVAFILIMIAVFALAQMIEKVLKTIKLNVLNRLAGAVFSLVSLMVVLSIGLNLLIEFDRDSRILSEQTRVEAYSFLVLKEVAPSVVPYLRFDWVERLSNKQ